MKDELVNNLYVIFMHKFVRIWKELGPARQMELGLVWNDYMESVGGHLQPWGTAVRHDRNDGSVLIRNPCEIAEGRNVSVTYISLPRELALKILVLGLP